MRIALLVAMREKGIRAKQLAGEVGVSQSFMSQVINGQRNPRLETAIRIANVLGEPMEDLFGDGIAQNPTGTEGVR